MKIRLIVSAILFLTLLNACGGQETERIITPQIISNTVNGGNQNPPPPTGETYEEVSSRGYFAVGQQTTVRIPDLYAGFCTTGQVTWSLERKNTAGEDLTPVGITLSNETTCAPTVSITDQFQDDETTKVKVILARPNDDDVLLKVVVLKRERPVIQFPTPLPANTVMSPAPGRPTGWPQTFREQVELLYSSSLYIPSGANYGIRDDQTWDLVMRTIYNGSSWTWRDGDRANTRVFANIPGLITDPDGLADELQVSGDCRMVLVDQVDQVITNGCPLNFRYGRSGQAYRDQFQNGDTQFEISFRGQQTGGIFQIQNNFNRPANQLDGRYGLLEIFLVARNPAGETRKSMAVMLFEIDN